MSLSTGYHKFVYTYIHIYNIYILYTKICCIERSTLMNMYLYYDGSQLISHSNLRNFRKLRGLSVCNKRALFDMSFAATVAHLTLKP